MPLLDLFWTMLMLFMFFLWIWLLISIFADIFRRDDIGGWGKAGWIFFIVVFVWLGAHYVEYANSSSRPDYTI